MACDAIREEDKFLSFLGGDEWPSEMGTSGQNLLQMNRYDEYVAENRVNDKDVLVSLLACYCHLFPQLATIKEDKYRANFIETTNTTGST